MASVIQAAHYGETEERLTRDPIVIQMEREIRETPLDQLQHPGGCARHELMGMANKVYRERGGTDGGHIGAIANAILRLRAAADATSPLDYGAWERDELLLITTEGETALCADAEALYQTVRALQAEGIYYRLDYYATLCLIEIGAYGVPWQELRAEAVRELDDRYRGSGMGISSSDINHTTIGIANGRNVIG